MKKVIKEYVTYEIGDVLDISQVQYKRELTPTVKSDERLTSIQKCKKAMVLSVSEVLTTKEITFSYKILADDGNMYTFKHSDQGNEKYIGSVDMSLLFDTKEVRNGTEENS